MIVKYPMKLAEFIIFIYLCSRFKLNREVPSNSTERNSMYNHGK